MQDEKVVLQSREHPLGCGCLMAGCLTFGLYFFWWYAKKLIVTNKRVIWRSGVIGSSERSIPLNRVTDIGVEQGLFGRILGYGSIQIESSGGPRTEIVAIGIENPQGIRDAILSQTS